MNLLGHCDAICQTLIHKLQWQCIEPLRRRDNALDAFLEQKGGGQSDGDGNDGISVGMKDATPTEYEFVAPNFCVFPNGVLPADSDAESDDTECNGADSGRKRKLSDIENDADGVAKRQKTESTGNE